ncbi:6007_t:CDS:2 [Diversispora eburnea]|uniref:6007_t:CDS:1 n=1 Tax=Diversispora eburnea TaxID=1213867 RepID=A0A9N8VAR8_9GLOM|nr:6007_t:CDS:2 [Diversispora eburnea]
MNQNLEKRKILYKSKGFHKPEDLLRNRQNQQIEICRQNRENAISANRLHFKTLALTLNNETVEKEDNEISFESQFSFEEFEEFEEMSKNLFSDSMKNQWEALTKFRNFLYIENSSIFEMTKVFDLRIVLRFVELLGSGHEYIQWEATIKNNLYNHLILNSGALNPLLTILNNLQENDSLYCIVSCALTTFCSVQIKSEVDWYFITPALPTLAQFLNCKDEMIIEKACWTFGSIAEGGIQQIQIIIELGICSTLIKLMNHPSCYIKLAALRCVTNMVTGDDFQIQMIINCGVLQILKELLSSSKEKDSRIRREACLLLSNITAGTVEQVEIVYQIGLFPILIELMMVADYYIRREACCSVSNAIIQGRNNFELILNIVRLECISPLGEILLNDNDNDLIYMILTAIQIILHLNITSEDGTKLESDQ